jgi:DNA-binding XRE family transcriptional regulator/predicted GIY-YIG superfamily endonuclease
MLDGKVYIGLSNNIERRWKEHIRNKSTSLIHQNIIKYGIENFKFEVLEECDEDMLETREEYWIEHYQSAVNGYNIPPSGNHPPIHYEEHGPLAALTDNQVDLIYKELQSTWRPYSEIAREFGIWSSSIAKIDKGLIRAKEGYDYPLRKSCIEQIDAKVDEIINLLKSTSLTHVEIARQVGVATSTVTMINLGRNNFSFNRTYPIRQHNSKTLEVESRNEQIIHLLKNTTISQSNIAKRFGVSPQTVRDIKKGRVARIEEEIYPIIRPSE